MTTTLERAAISVQEAISDAFFDNVEPDPKDIARAVLMAVRDSSGVDFLVNAPVRCDNIISGYIDAILNETPE